MTAIYLSFLYQGMRSKSAYAWFSSYWNWWSFCFCVVFVVFCLPLKLIESWGLQFPFICPIAKVFGATVSTAYLRKPSWGEQYNWQSQCSQYSWIKWKKNYKNVFLVISSIRMTFNNFKAFPLRLIFCLQTYWKPDHWKLLCVNFN